MRRKEKQIVPREEIDAVIRASKVIRLAMARDNQPYLVPLAFGYDGRAIYLHTAATGRKISFFEANNRVCFEFEQGVELLEHGQRACNWSFAFKSVIGDGVISELTKLSDKNYALSQIMSNYSDKPWRFEDLALSRTRTWKITIRALSGKQSLYQEN